MSLKYGKKVEIKVNPLAYNIGLIGESGIGKSTIIKEYCEKLAGEEGYLFLEIGKEDGADAIEGLNAINCPEWELDYDDDTNSIGFNTIIEDIIENRTTDWKDLKVIVIDTYDELFAIAEQEVLRMHNRKNPNKKAESIKSALGGFQAGEDKAVEIVLDRLWSLKRVNVSFIIIGHTKNKNVSDIVTGEEYQQLTSNLPTKYFNAIKTKLHILGVAYIDREIVREKTGKKNIVTKQDIKKGVIKNETRKITFRDNDYAIDCKSRFSVITDSISFDSDELIKAVTDAIKNEIDKSGKEYDDIKKEQEKKEKKEFKKIADKEANDKKQKLLNEKIEIINEYFMKNKSNLELIKPILAMIREKGFKVPTEIDSLEFADEVIDIINK